MVGVQSPTARTTNFFDQLALESSPAAAVNGGHYQPPLSLPPPPPPPPSPVVLKPPQASSPRLNTSSVSMTVVDPISVAAPAVAMSIMIINRFPLWQFNVSRLRIRVLCRCLRRMSRMSGGRVGRGNGRSVLGG
ncbi:hypothetical protein L1987_68979 [Smallanthus sonchifolius]|uniref:Uncharacterized protein n=1 Tax=Smallanthus sonchifolius TaxID=185202 RepID=A0ACB9B4N7_9ASTR|nr:hypothetical protein L1987_68979 [Smallanthus sonchifolius]